MRSIRPSDGSRYLAALDNLHGDAKDRAARLHYDELDREGQESAIRDLAARGYSDHTIASIVRWNVSQVRTVLGDRGRQ